MNKGFKYYMVHEKALPEVLKKVAQVNTLLSSGRVEKIQEAIDLVGISRSSYYKYKDDVFPIHEKIEGKTITFVMEMEDQPGYLSNVLKAVADCQANVLSIHQSIPVNHIALITLSVLVLSITADVSELFEKIRGAPGIHHLKIVSAE
ncbi:MAG: ACT domain-containing protein [Eubacterium sp.]|nr:ACT domain-containing protein [Eubacterium sp.]